MDKFTSVTMAAAVAGILTLAVLTVGLHQVFASGEDKNNNQKQITKIAIGGNGGSGGAAGAGGEGGSGGVNINKDTPKANDGDSNGGDSNGGHGGNVDQNANGGDSNGGHGGNANGGEANILNNQKK